MFDFTQLSDRINYALKKSGKTQMRLAEDCGVKSSSVNAWTTGKTKDLMSSVAYKASKSLDTDLEWLITGKGAPDIDDVSAINDDELPSDEYVQIKEYGIKCAAGNGCEPTYEEQSESVPATYRRSWFQKLQINPEHCKRFVVYGDSMEPVLFSDDRILVNLDDKYPIKNNKVYAIVYGNEVRVKRLIALMNGDLVIHSDNPRYPEEIIHKDDDINFSIIGRVIEKAGNGGL